MNAIKFDGLLFLSIDKLVSYISRRYGSLAGVPEDHPQIAVVSALHGLNEEYFFDLEGLAVQRPRHDWPG